MSSYAKGSSKNPYTQSEFDALCDANNWHGGYVEGQGYVGPLVVVDGSYSSGSSESSWSEDSWSSECSQSDDSQNISDSNTSSYSSTNSQGGSNNSPNKNDSKNNKNEVKEHLQSAINNTKRFGNRIFDLINRLYENNILKIGEQANVPPRYIPNKHAIIWPNDLLNGEIALVHETIHYLQANLGMLGDNCSSNNEMQAYVMNFIIFSVTGEGEWAKISAIEGEMDQIGSLIEGHIWIDKKNELCYDSDLITVLNSRDWNSVLQQFSDYFINSISSDTYSKGMSNKYEYKWDLLFQQIAILKNEK